MPKTQSQDKRFPRDGQREEMKNEKIKETERRKKRRKKKLYQTTTI